MNVLQKHEDERKKVWNDTVSNLLRGRYSDTSIHRSSVIESTIICADSILEAYDQRFPINNTKKMV